MREFFKFVWCFFRGWKRKFGCVTLIIASAFACGWIRSSIIVDSVEREDFKLVSDGQAICFWKTVSDNPEYWEDFDFFSLDFIQFESILKSGDDAGFYGWDDWYENPSNVDHVKYRFYGFAYNEQFAVVTSGNKNVAALTLKCWRVPYWSVVIPLTALSAFLLIAKPKTSTQQKTPEYIANEGA